MATQHDCNEPVCKRIKIRHLPVRLWNCIAGLTGQLQNDIM